MRVLLGPILLALDVSPVNQAWGIGLCLVLIPGMLIGLLRPRWWSALVSAMAALVWIFFGVIGEGINC
jgi:hypothetical protein